MKEFRGQKFILVVENASVPLDTRVWYEARSLKNAGADVFVISPMLGIDSERYTVVDDIPIYRYRGAFSGETKFGYVKEYVIAFLKTALLIHRLLLRHFPIHVVHVANPPDIFWPLAVYLKLFGAKFIFDEHDLSPEMYLSKYGSGAKSGAGVFKLHKLMEELSYKFSDAIISTNESYRERAISVNPAYAAKTFVVRNGPDTRLTRPQPANPSLKKGRTHLAAFFGVMAVHDGVDNIIRAMDIIVNRYKYQDLIVYLIGGGSEWNRLRQLARQLKVDDQIVFTGYMTYDHKVLEILSTADFGLSPDPYNTLNNLSTMCKIMDYMALGKPVVSFDLKESRVSAGNSAIYAENNSVPAFADGMLKLISDPRRRLIMGKLGKRRIDRALSWQKQERHLLNVYRHLLSK